MRNQIIILILFTSIIYSQSNTNYELIDTNQICIGISDSFGWGGGSRTFKSCTLLIDGQIIYQYSRNNEKKVEIGKKINLAKIDEIKEIVQKYNLENLPRHLSSRKVMGPSSVLSITYRNENSKYLNTLTYFSGSTKRTKDMNTFSEAYKKLISEFQSLK